MTTRLPSGAEVHPRSSLRLPSLSVSQPSYTFHRRLSNSSPSILFYSPVQPVQASLSRSGVVLLCLTPSISPHPPTLSLTPLCELSATGLCEEINRDPTPRSSANVPEEDKGTTTPGSLMFQRFHARAYPRYSRLVYASFREFYASRNKKDAGALTWKRERRVGIAG